MSIKYSQAARKVLISNTNQNTVYFSPKTASRTLLASDPKKYFIIILFSTLVFYGQIRYLLYDIISDAVILKVILNYI